MQNGQRFMTVEDIKNSILQTEGKIDKESQDLHTIYKDYLYRCVAYTVESSFPFVLATAKEQIAKQEEHLRNKTNYLSTNLEQAKKLNRKSIPEYMQKYPKIFELFNLANNDNNINQPNTLDNFITDILNQIQLSEDPSFNKINVYTFGPYLKITMSTKSTNYLINNYEESMVSRIVELAYCRWLVYHLENNLQYELNCLLEDGKNTSDFQSYKTNTQGLNYILTKERPLQDLISIVTKLIINYEYYENLTKENQLFLIQHKQVLNYLYDPIYYVCDILSQANVLGVPFERVPKNFYENACVKAMMERQLLSNPLPVEELNKEIIFTTLKQNEVPAETSAKKL